LRPKLLDANQNTSILVTLASDLLSLSVTHLIVVSPMCCCADRL